jgi:drug/metabolite transporter (DMT)-like permease
MSLAVGLAVIGAALAHAAWNAILRMRGDRLLLAALIAAVTSLLALPLLPFFPLPAPAAWPFIAATVPIHTAYYVTLARAYDHGDLAQVYPLARGLAPLLTLLVSVAAFDDTVGAWPAVGIGLLSAGVALLAMEGGIAKLRASPASTSMALATAVSICGYTIADGHGGRLSGNVHGFTLWIFLLNGVPLVLFTLATRRRALLEAACRSWRPAVAAAILSMAAYWIVLWAMTQAPIPQVAALRETSVVFAMLIGLFILRERMTLIRASSPILVLGGLALMRMG